MKIACCILLAPAFAMCLAASEPPAEETMATRFAVLVGFPSSGPATGGEVLLVPGSVIPLDPDGGAQQADTGQAAQNTLSFARTVEKLWAAFRLDPGRQFEKGKLVAAMPGKQLELPGMPEAGIRLMATLRSFDAATAVFHVMMTQGERPIADSTVKVNRGGRAVVGGLGGDKAPYIFLVIEPEDLTASPKSTERLRKAPGVTVPHPLTKVAPSYPEDAKKKAVSGVVVLQLQIGTSGAVEDLKVVEYPDPSLSRAAVDAVRQWKFEPARLDDGTAVAAICLISVNFQLR